MTGKKEREPNSVRVWLYVSKSTKRKLTILAAYHGGTIADLLTDAATKMVMQAEAERETGQQPQA